MKTVAYLQIVPKFAPNGRLIGISPKKVSSKHPTDPLAGAVTLKLKIEIPDRAFTPIEVNVNVPIEALESTATVVVDQNEKHASV